MRLRSTTSPKAQRGVAIITALLIVALATVISANIATSLQLEVRRTGNLISIDQALLYIKPAEQLARNVLRDDAKDNNIDWLGEPWAFDIPPIPVDGGTITGKITDLQGCFNINSLQVASGANAATIAVAKQRFDRLTQVLQLQTRPTDAIIDWLDADVNTTIPDGAEDGYYLNLEQPYRSANQAMVSISTLKLVRGFREKQNAKDYERIKPFVCAYGKLSDINVNTAPVEVLLSLADDISSEANEAVLQRKNTPFENLEDFLKLGALKTKITNTTGLSVKSDTFLLQTRLEIGLTRKTIYSIINRSSDGVTSILYRSQNTL